MVRSQGNEASGVPNGKLLFKTSEFLTAQQTTGSLHKLCDRLYFEFIEAMYGNIENPRIIVLDCDRYSHLISK